MEDLQVNMDNQNTEGKSLNVFKKILGVFISPAKVMGSIETKPGFLVPLILTMAAPVLLIIARYSDYLELLKQTLVESYAKRNAQLTAEQLAAQLKMVGTFGCIGAPVGVIVSWLVGTAILFGIVKIFKGQGSFKQYLSVTAYASVITILSYILLGIVSYFTGLLDLNTPVTSVISLLPQSFKGTFLYGLLLPVDVLTIWEYVVIAIGVRQMSKLDKNKVYTIIGIIYGAMMLYGGIGQIIAGIAGR